ncbi:MAG: efflux RND transporter periplasmic adaptor subunit [Cellvibrionaceae bacterium]|nr:efflux RND transporter periplasmic adaptor subunit [Cellvibrionaceae bacterium]
MNRLLKFIAPAAVIGLGVAAVAVLNLTKPEPEKKEQASQAPSLFVESVTSQQVTLSVRTQAEVKPITEIDLVSQVSGMVKKVSPEYIEGGRFEAGQTLLWIDDADYQLALKRAQARVAEARTRVEQTEADAAVARQQLKGYKNPSALALKKPQLAEAAANLKAAEADLAQAELNLKRTKISLPFAGRLKSISANIGQYIGAGSKLGRAFATDKVKLRLPLSDSQLASLNLPIGFVAEADNAPLVELSATVGGQLKTWQGQLTRVAAAFDQNTRLVYALAEVKDPYAQQTPLAVGLYVKAQVYGETLEQALAIPRAALRAGNKIYVVDENKRLDVREVQVIEKSPERALIRGAVQAGEQVVVSPLRNPSQGMAVNTMSRDKTSATMPQTKELSANG